MFDRLVPEPLAAVATAHLHAEGVQRGAIVAWLGHNSWDMIATLVACERLGAVLLPLNWRLAAAELARIVGHAGAGHLMGTPELQGLAEDVLRLARMTEFARMDRRSWTSFGRVSLLCVLVSFA